MKSAFGVEHFSKALSARQAVVAARKAKNIAAFKKLPHYHSAIKPKPVSKSANARAAIKAIAAKDPGNTFARRKRFTRLQGKDAAFIESLQRNTKHKSPSNVINLLDRMRARV